MENFNNNRVNEVAANAVENVVETAEKKGFFKTKAGKIIAGSAIGAAIIGCGYLIYRRCKAKKAIDELVEAVEKASEK